MSLHPHRIEAGPQEESVWDYPRPPRLEQVGERLRVEFAGEIVAETAAGWRVLETSHPPVYYFPPDSVRREFIVPSPGRSFCEWKGEARYVSLDVRGSRSEAAGWFYPAPTLGFEALKDCIAFYASRVDAAFVGDERVQPQAGDFYGGWITARILGPFKGAPGTRGW